VTSTVSGTLMVVLCNDSLSMLAVATLVNEGVRFVSCPERGVWSSASVNEVSVNIDGISASGDCSLVSMVMIISSVGVAGALSVKEKLSSPRLDTKVEGVEVVPPKSEIAVVTDDSTRVSWKRVDSSAEVRGVDKTVEPSQKTDDSCEAIEERSSASREQGESDCGVDVIADRVFVSAKQLVKPSERIRKRSKDIPVRVVTSSASWVLKPTAVLEGSPFTAVVMLTAASLLRESVKGATTGEASNNTRPRWPKRRG
jgi:hypothetical protein